MIGSQDSIQYEISWHLVICHHDSSFGKVKLVTCDWVSRFGPRGSEVVVGDWLLGA